MKKSISKKVLALFLSVLMVVTAVPFMAFAANDTEYNTLKNYVTKYENDIANHSVYSNMQAAYNAYVAAKRATDAYYYGGDKNVALTGAVLDNIKNATASYAAAGGAPRYIDHVQWTDKKGKSYENDDIYLKWARPTTNKVVYSDVVDGNQHAQIMDETKDPIFMSKMFYASAVLLYDGDNNTGHPRFPAMLWGYHRKPGKDLLIHTIYPGTWSGSYSNRYADPDFKVLKPYTSNNPQAEDNKDRKGEVSGWVGAAGEPNALNYGYMFETGYWDYFDGDAARSTTAYTRKGTIKDGNYKYFSSSVIFDGGNTMNTLAAQGNYTFSKDIHWVACGSYNNVSNLMQDYTPQGHTIYVINYQKFSQTNPTVQSRYNTISKIEDYISMGNMSMFMNGVGTGYQFNPSNYSYAGRLDAAVGEVNGAIKAVVDSSNIALSSNDSYRLLAAKMDTCKATYEDLKSKGVAGTIYTTDSYNAYIKAYEDAQKLFPTNNAYNDFEGAKTAAANLNVTLVERANYGTYQTAKDNLATKLNTTEHLSIASLDALTELIKNSNYYNAADINNFPYDKHQTAMNEEAGKLTVSADPNYKTYEAAKEAIEAKIAQSDNNDMFNVAALQEAINEAKPLTKAYTINGNSYTGYDYDAATTALQTALSESTYRYTVKVDGSDEPIVYDGRTEFTYGETVKVGEAEYNSKVKPGRTATWMEPVYIGSTDKIVVRGDTVLTKCTGEGENVKVVKFVSGGQVYDIQSTTESPFDLSKANIYAPSHYTVSGYKVGDETYDVNGQLPLNETGTTEVTVLFKADTKLGEVTVNGETHTFGEKVTLNSKDGSEVGFYAANGDHLWNGTSYTFYARENVTITTDGEVSTVVGAHTSRIEPSNGKVYFYGGISNADESNVLSQGMIIELDGEGTKDLTLAAVDGEHIFNVTAQRIDSVTKQYSISMPENAASKVRCRAYVAYKTTEDGKEVIKYVYSNATQVYPAPSNEVTA